MVEAYGAAVAIPERVARSDEEPHIVATKVHTGKGTQHLCGVFGFFNTHPSLGVSFLYAVHEVEEHTAKAGVGIHHRTVGTVYACRVPTCHYVVFVIFGIACNNRVGHIIA